MSQTACSGDLVVWVISTGTEILQGHYSDSNAPWMSARLLALGLATARHMALPDEPGALREGIALAARCADLVITSGGLGPTCDDLNRDVICAVWDAPLSENAEALERIRERFRRRGREMTANNQVQAMIPAGAVILQNDNGTAPGFYLRPAPGGPRATILALPGPPRELQPMFERQAAPLIAEQFCDGRVRLRTFTLHTTGLPESWVNEQLKDLFGSDPRVNVALLAKLGQVDIRLTLMGPSEAVNAALEEQWREIVRGRVGADFIYGEQAMTLPGVVGQLLAWRGQTLAVAESCTGGLIGARLTDVPGSSAYFKEGFITYANEAKMARLGVDAATLERHGAVSAETAAAMARGARRAAGADWAIGVTGIAGPGGGSAEKPVGLVYLGLAGPDGRTLVQRHPYTGDRQDVRDQAAQGALDLLRRALLGAPVKDALTVEPD